MSGLKQAAHMLGKCSLTLLLCPHSLSCCLGQYGSHPGTHAGNKDVYWGQNRQHTCLVSAPLPSLVMPSLTISLSHLTMPSCLTVPSLISPCPLSSRLAMPCLISPCPLLPCPLAFSCHALSFCCAFSHHAFSHCALSCRTLLFCHALSHLLSPHPLSSHLAMPFHLISLCPLISRCALSSYLAMPSLVLPIPLWPSRFTVPSLIIVIVLACCYPVLLYLFYLFIY